MSMVANCSALRDEGAVYKVSLEEHERIYIIASQCCHDDHNHNNLR